MKFANISNQVAVRDIPDIDNINVHYYYQKNRSFYKSIIINRRWIIRGKLVWKEYIYWILCNFLQRKELSLKIDMPPEVMSKNCVVLGGFILAIDELRRIDLTIGVIKIIFINFIFLWLLFLNIHILLPLSKFFVRYSSNPCVHSPIRNYENIPDHS